MTLKTPYPALLAQLTKLSIVPRYVVQELAKSPVRSIWRRSAAAPYEFVKLGSRCFRCVSFVKRRLAGWGNKGPVRTSRVPAPGAGCFDPACGPAGRRCRFRWCPDVRSGGAVGRLATVKAVPVLTEEWPSSASIRTSRLLRQSCNCAGRFAYAIDKGGIMRRAFSVASTSRSAR